MSYTMDEHSHRLAAWAASTAARASNKCRFNVEAGVTVLERSGFGAGFSVHQLPLPPHLDLFHRDWRESAIKEGEALGLANFTHGVAAKLINCYLKVRFVCGGHHHDPRVAALHPPIDRLLLGSLAKVNFGGERRQWREYCMKGWSTFDSKTYEAVIKLIHKTLGPGKPLWKIEEHWDGHQ